MPMISTYFFGEMLLIKVYLGPGPFQQPVNSVVPGLFGGSVGAGGAMGVSVKLGVGVTVGGGGVGE